MGPAGSIGTGRAYTKADLRAIELDEVARAHRLMAAHTAAGLEITTPRVNGTDEFMAKWDTGTAHHADLRHLCDYLDRTLGSRVA